VRRRLAIAAVVLLAAAAIALGWIVSRPREPATALARATRALARAPGDADAAWQRARALEALGLSHVAIEAYEAIAARGGDGRGDEPGKRAESLRASLAAAQQRARHSPPAAAVAALDVAMKALRDGDAIAAERQAQTALTLAREANVDPTDVPRRCYIVLADAARARGQTALANAYVDEARALMR
jgi:tetratricopeptide (TPR) repeat protein